MTSKPWWLKERALAFRERQKDALEFCLSVGYERAVGPSDPFASGSAEDFWGSTVGMAIEDFFEDFMELLDAVSVEGATRTTLEATKMGRFRVDPMTTEADHLQIMALSSQLQVTVVYLDRSEGSAAEHPFAAKLRSGESEALKC
eukprot:s2587_g9.t1